ncbi:protein ELF4-LIKE 3-like [Papaver somniferum]|uniref:protein ELF4-LIKE 3-like n=1 Tax=Papaver somniferum TaxID=3469 RepID=UPI000E703792|nr:protein ELF4-LIKE 3-like [Papaver somniferum]
MAIKNNFLHQLNNFVDTGKDHLDAKIEIHTNRATKNLQQEWKGIHILGLGNGGGTQVDSKVLQTFQKSFVQVQNILDQNRLLINEINQNHESKIPDNLSRNVGLIRELNNNIRRVVDLYGDLSSSFAKSMDVSSEGDSMGGGSMKSGQKRIKHG